MKETEHRLAINREFSELACVKFVTNKKFDDEEALINCCRNSEL